MTNHVLFWRNCTQAARFALYTSRQGLTHVVVNNILILASILSFSLYDYHYNRSLASQTLFNDNMVRSWYKYGYLHGKEHENR